MTCHDLHHAAALSILGWYLLIPPQDGTTPPISAWAHGGSFDSAKECEESLKIAHASAVASRGKFIIQSITADTGRIMFRRVEPRCIATDDPRLGEQARKAAF